MTWHQISGIHPGPLYGVSDPVGAMSTKQGTDPEIGFSKNLAAQGFKSYAAAVAKLGCEGFGEVTEMPMGYYMQTLLDGDGNEFVTMLFHPIGLEFAGYCFYPSSLLTAKMSAEIPAKLDVKTRIRLQELAADIAQRWEESPMISDSPGINMFSIQDIEAQGLHAHMFFEWGTDALPFRPFIEVTDGNHDVVGIYNRFGVEYARDEDGVLYRVDDIDYSRSTGGAGVPTTFGLSQNYPNPFNAATNIEFALPEDGRVKLEIYDILGQRVRTLVDEYRAAGTYSVEFDSGSLASGMYFYRLIAGDFAETKKMVLMK